MPKRPQNIASSILVVPVSCLSCSSVAQGPPPREARSSADAFVVVAATPVQGPPMHKFWNKGNRILFAANTVLTAADFAVTRANHQNGRARNPRPAFSVHLQGDRL